MGLPIAGAIAQAHGGSIQVQSELAFGKRLGKMARSDFRFYAELNDFLPPSKRLVSFAHIFEGQVSINDMIEAQGVPHTEVDRILVNDHSVDFSYIVQDRDPINVYPVSEAPNITELSLVRPKPLFVARFVLDIHLGKLATFLRMLIFDTLYRND